MNPSTGRQFCLLLITLICIAGAACLPKSKPATLDLPDGRVVEARQVRVWIYDLTNRLAGRIETAADEIMESADDPAVRHMALEWKASGVPALQGASFNPDPIVALSDLWLFSVQLQDFFRSEKGRQLTGAYAELALETATQMEQDVLDFIHDRGGTPEERGTTKLIHDYAAAHPIEHSIGTRPTAASVLTERIPTGSIGAFAAVGTLVEGFADLSDRISIYGEHLPKQIRWQLEMLFYEMGLQKNDIDAIEADVVRLGRRPSCPSSRRRSFRLTSRISRLPSTTGSHSTWPSRWRQ